MLTDLYMGLLIGLMWVAKSMLSGLPCTCLPLYFLLGGFEDGKLKLALALIVYVALTRIDFLGLLLSGLAALYRLIAGVVCGPSHANKATTYHYVPHAAIGGDGAAKAQAGGGTLWQGTKAQATKLTSLLGSPPKKQGAPTIFHL